MSFLTSNIFILPGPRFRVCRDIRRHNATKAQSLGHSQVRRPLVTWEVQALEGGRSGFQPPCYCTWLCDFPASCSTYHVSVFSTVPWVTHTPASQHCERPRWIHSGGNEASSPGLLTSLGLFKTLYLLLSSYFLFLPLSRVSQLA